MAVVYTTESVIVTPTTRDAAEGEGFLLEFDVVRDGATVIRHFEQFFLVGKTNVEMFDDLRPLLREAVEDDYRQLKQATLAGRAQAIRTVIDNLEWTWP